ncbi:MAG: hypothetical protein J7641_17340 [Cyanobacteria bacterium SID2]|nr:hypothetical protein [Cyanobacteria bacterium SID2]MBP0003761.1 hypothetical protein [Cyanobacteria bacterium SBC]
MSERPADLDNVFQEIAMADLLQFQIAIPTGTVKNHKNSLGLSTPKRIYSDRGWVHLSSQIIGRVQGLRLKSISRNDSPFKISPRLSNGVPISFEIAAQQPLPEFILFQALFCYQFETSSSFHYALFQNIKPQFVRIYSLESKADLAAQFEIFLINKKDFMRQHKTRLKK